jgi:hypothetical protein
MGYYLFISALTNLLAGPCLREGSWATVKLAITFMWQSISTVRMPASKQSASLCSLL